MTGIEPLGAHSERPSSRRAAEYANECASLHMPPWGQCALRRDLALLRQLDHVHGRRVSPFLARPAFSAASSAQNALTNNTREQLFISPTEH